MTEMGEAEDENPLSRAIYIIMYMETLLNL